jgi:lysophospholipase L1-like esterase
MSRSLGLLVLAVLLAACSPPNTGERTSAPTHQEERAAGQGTTAVADAPVSLDYVALGDSLAVGVGAKKGYVDRYASYITADTGARIDLVNLGRSGQTSSQLLHALRTDPAMRHALGTAEVITFNIGINDLGVAGEAYENGSCGGGDNQKCLRAAVEAFKRNWSAIIAELLSLRSTEDAIIRTAGIGYTPRVEEIFEPYIHEVNRHIATTAASHDIPYAQPHLEREDMSPDGVHPNDHGYEVIADRLRELGYGPLSPPR